MGGYFPTKGSEVLDSALIHIRSFGLRIPVEYGEVLDRDRLTLRHKRGFTKKTNAILAMGAPPHIRCRAGPYNSDLLEKKINGPMRPACN